MLVTLTIRNLNKTQAIPPREQAHRFGVYSDVTRSKHADGQVFFMKMYSHVVPLHLIVSARKEANTKNARSAQRFALWAAFGAYSKHLQA